LPEISSIYYPKEFQDKYLDFLDRLAAAKNKTRNQMILEILKDVLDKKRRFFDAKITDYEMLQQSIKKKKHPLVYCSSCQQSAPQFKDIIHKVDCSLMLQYYKVIQSNTNDEKR
jgi:hypothetical protein